MGEKGRKWKILYNQILEVFPSVLHNLIAHAGGVFMDWSITEGILLKTTVH